MVEEGEMPLWFYVPLHPDAALSQKDIDTLVEWSTTGSGRNHRPDVEW